MKRGTQTGTPYTKPKNKHWLIEVIERERAVQGHSGTSLSLDAGFDGHAWGQYKGGACSARSVIAIERFLKVLGLKLTVRATRSFRVRRKV